MNSTSDTAGASPLRLSLIMPVYNEERTLPQIIDQIFTACGTFCEVIFVDDGSTDSSLQILKSRARPVDTVLTKQNGGKGSAVRMGLTHAKGTYTVIQDADLEYEPAQLAEMLQFAEKNAYPIVFGSRRLTDQKQYSHIAYYIGGVSMTVFCNMLYGTRLTDQTTCYKLVRTEIMQSLPLQYNDFRFDIELTVLLAKRRFSIHEYPINYHPRSAAEGKKIRATDWIKGMWLLFVMRFW